MADAVAIARQGGGRSEIYEWLWADFDALAPALNRVGVNWDGLAELAISGGLKAGRGAEPTGEVVRQTWIRVRRDKQAPPRPVGRPKAKAARVSIEATRTAASPPPVTPPRLPATRAKPQDDDLPDDFFAKPRYK